MFYYIEPEIAGGFGKDTIMDASIHPPVVKNLEYRFEGWLGDELLETFPCFILTERLARRIIALRFTGFSLDSVIVSKSVSFEEMEPSTILPLFYWLKVDGKAGVSDFGVANDHRLVVSDRVVGVLNGHHIQNAGFEIYIR
ncbi:hypothetical protein [Pseudomonas sp. LB3P31]